MTKTKRILSIFKVTEIQSEELMTQLSASGYILSDGIVAFAENVLLDLFFELPGGSVQKLNLESGEWEAVCDQKSDFEKTLVNQGGNYFTAQTLLDDWEKQQHKKLEEGNRLCPTTPFVLGGEFKAFNLHEVQRVKAIEYLIDVFRQTKDINDGNAVSFVVTP